MLDFINLLISCFSSIISFFDSFVIFGTISIFRLFIIIFLFKICLKFLLKHKGGN